MYSTNCSITQFMYSTNCSITQFTVLDIRGTLHHSTIHKENIQLDAIMYQNFYISIVI